MGRTLDQIRTSSLSANLVQAAARGALVLPPEETIEILVYLANNNKVYGDIARMTLAGWDEKSSMAAAANPNSPSEVLQYFVSPQNLRPKLLPGLLENPSVPEKALAQLALTGSRDAVEAILSSPRAKNSSVICAALSSNPRLKDVEAAALKSAPTQPAEATPNIATENATGSSATAASATGTTDPLQADADLAADPAADAEVAAFMAEHASEIAAEEGKPFHAIGGIHDEFGSTTTHAPEAPPASSSAEGAGTQTAPLSKTSGKPPIQVRRGSALQKIASLDVKGRIQLAMKGSKEERSILIRDGTKIVALAVLDSPKISDGEVENFANQKNVLEAVLRGILMKRRFAKNYTVIRNLVANPRTPIDVALGLMKNLLVGDLKNLANNKDVSDTVRKLALRMFKQKSETGKKE